MQRVNEFVLKPINYQDNELLMWDDAATILNILTKNEFVAVVRQDEFKNTFIEFETENRDMGAPYPFWLSPEELETVVWDDEEVEEEI